ncbi:hypothetical protein N7468_004283 [Penicillium chermesinum]|uniref:Uncharacterized protein n=1 Tax=Penicillium chermesinum TaxID=63820 RepID=A0A9W9TU69_9EURO|nr:uncharacterized protein N7468_004283 [Penicillium chermesinum]KAJ5239664.1 hypothetical protein N7468_004283 [Penicillium chermesinum]KAJ6166553.1 hypothetical protein N7470_002000 [Penicillium chermesinum]
MSLNGLNHDEWVNGFQDVFKIFFTIYALAKIMQVCFLGYGSDLDSAPQGLSYWIQRAETEIRTDSLAELIEIVENLFYTLYARIMLELAGTELCSLFPITERPVRSKSLYYLPSPSRLHRIFLAFKDILDCPDICENLHLELMTQYLESYIRRLICSDARKGRPGSGDTLGYYQHALAIARDRESDFRKKWDSLMECFADFPPQTITSLSDKYLTVLPRAIPTIETATSDLPFVNLKMLSPESWDQIMIEEHRYNALAQLESRTVGEYRRMDPNCNLLEELKYHRCVCSSICSCAKDCTYDTERACPCSEWQMHLQLVTNRKTAGPHDFATRVNTIALACFQGLNFLKKEISDHDLIMEIQSIFKVIELEVQKERSNGKLAPRPDAAP